MTALWDNRNHYIRMSQEQFTQVILSHGLYKTFIREYPNIESFMKYFIADILRGLTSVADGSHKYFVTSEGIGYEDKVANTIRTTTSYGHSTAFAAIKEAQAGQISQEKLNFYAELSFECGSLSYAELPRLFDLIVGVTGTLYSLSTFENNLLENYRIKTKTDIPSVYNKKPLQGGDNAWIYGGDIDAPDKEGYFYNIKESIDAVMARDRAVLVVFKTQKRLEAYQKFIANLSYSTKSVRTNTLLISTKDTDRDLMVAEAAQRKRITLMSREFGRGTDFVCRDSQLRNSGGVAVICTFFPEHPAEEVQIKGRTNRQNDPGSFKMILFLGDLVKFGITTLNEFDQASSKYNYLVQKREEYQQKKSEEIQASLYSAKVIHEKTVKLNKLLTPGYSSLFSRDSIPDAQKKEALEILRSFNQSNSP